MPLHPAPILSSVCFFEDDYRSGGVNPKSSRGVLSICCFGDRHLLLGCRGKLWGISWKHKRGYKNDWPWICNPNRLKVETILCHLDLPKDPCTYFAESSIFERKPKSRYYRFLLRGRLEYLNHLLIRLQRWTRRMIQRPKTLALFMALHSRLGAKSGLAELGEDILSLIVTPRRT